MAYLTGETVKQVLKDIYGYEISAADAASIARGAGSMLAMAEHLGALGLDGVEPPFNFPTLIEEAERLLKRQP